MKTLGEIAWGEIKEVVEDRDEKREMKMMMMTAKKLHQLQNKLHESVLERASVEMN